MKLPITMISAKVKPRVSVAISCMKVRIALYVEVYLSQSGSQPYIQNLGYCKGGSGAARDIQPYNSTE
jgi:hypothetical protein